MTISVFPFPASTDISEKYDWLTSVISCKNGETLEALREYSRYTVEYSYIFRNIKDFNYAKTLAERIGVDKFYLPVWWSYGVAVGISSGVTSFSLVVNFLDLPSVVKYVLLYSANDNWEVAEINTLIGNTVTLLSPITKNYNKLWVIPLIEGTTSGITFEKGRGNLYKAKLTFNGDYSLPLPNALEVFPTLETVPVISVRFLDNPAFTFTLTKSYETLESPLGITEQIANKDYAQYSFTLTLTASTHATSNQTLATLNSLKGRGSIFWLPSTSQDLKMITPTLAAGATSLIVETTNYSTTVTVNRAVKITGKEGIFYTMLGAVTNLTAFTDSLEIAIPSVIDITEITSVEFMYLVRLDSDSIAVNYTNKKFLRASLALITAKFLLTLAIVTSTLYPFSHQDFIAINSGITELVGLGSLIDNVGVTSTVTDIELVAINMPKPVDSLNINSTITNIILAARSPIYLTDSILINSGATTVTLQTMPNYSYGLPESIVLTSTVTSITLLTI